MDIIYRVEVGRGEEPGTPSDAQAARERLEAGNRSFAGLLAGEGAEAEANVIPVSEAAALGGPGKAPPQRPFAAVLGCADARAPVELVFQQAFNDLFVVRVAGNLLAAEGLGSLAYAAANMTESLRTVVVLGHSGCGAVTAAVDAFLDSSAYPQGTFGFPLRALVDRIMISVVDAHAALARGPGEDVRSRPGYRAALVETAVVLNAAGTAMTLRHELCDPAPGELGAVFGVYDLASQRVSVPGAVGDDEVALLPAPKDAGDLEQLAARVASSPKVSALLDD